MSKVVRIGITSEGASVLDAPKKITCDWVAKNIDCEWIEIVRPNRLEKGFIMLVDEEGLLKSNFVNLAASWMYETDKHGSPIAGKVMIVKEVMGPDGPEFAGMTDEEATMIAGKYGDPANWREWHGPVMKALGH